MGAESPIQGAQFGNDNVQINNFGSIKGDVVQVAGNYEVQHFSPSPPTARVDTAPALASGTVRRSDLIQSVVSALCPPGGGHRVALAGVGGLGKTTTATVVCREDAVIARYPGGVAWIPVGQGRRGTALSQTIGQATYMLTGREAAIIDPDQAVQHLAALLPPDSLVVVDDIWTADQLSPFRFLGDHGCLVTTRNRTSLTPGVQVIAVGEMSDAEGRELLSASTGRLGERDVAVDIGPDRALAAAALACQRLSEQVCHARARYT